MYDKKKKTLLGYDIKENGNELFHYGIKGQKWGVRRYQNEDGTLTEAGKKRYRAYSQYVDEKNAEIKRLKSENENYNKAILDIKKGNYDSILDNKYNTYDDDDSPIGALKYMKNNPKQFKKDYNESPNYYKKDMGIDINKSVKENSKKLMEEHRKDLDAYVRHNTKQIKDIEKKVNDLTSIGYKNASKILEKKKTREIVSNLVSAAGVVSMEALNYALHGPVMGTILSMPAAAIGYGLTAGPSAAIRIDDQKMQKLIDKYKK